MEGKDGKTEKATPKKRSESRRKGQVVMSQDVTSVAVLLLGLFVLRIQGASILAHIAQLMGEIYRFPQIGHWDPKLVQTAMIYGTGLMTRLMLPLCGAAMLGGIIASVSQTGPYFEVEPLEWKLTSLNPVNGVKKLFSLQSVVNLGLSILKMSLIGTVFFLLVRRRIFELTTLSYFTIGMSLSWIMTLAYRVAMWAVVIFIAIAALDWIYKKYKNEKDMMMSKEEVKEERKQQESSPHVKRAQRKKMRELSLLRMMADVPKATVVVTNPTHVAVALQYDPATMDAPKVTAKGLRLVAQRIKQIAAEHDVPILERPELARSLYKEVEVGRQIPAQFFEAIAEILAYLHKLGRRVMNI